jgi:hypothetical protein
MGATLLSPAKRHMPEPRAEAVPNNTVPPHPFDAQWYAHVDGQTCGPYSGHQIRRMAQQRQIVGTDLLCREKESAWVQAENDPIIGAVFPGRREIRANASPGIAFATGSASFWGLTKVALLAFLLIALGWFAWPYYALYDLAAAIREGDVAQLENRVVWDSVRQGLRDDLNAVFLQRLRTDATLGNSDVGAGIAALLGPAVIDRMVDAYLTPQAISNLIRTGKDPHVATDDPPIGANTNVGAEPQHQFSLRQVKHAFFLGGPLTFKVEIIPANDPDRRPVTLLFKWTGDWRLTRVVMPIEGLRTTRSEARPAIAAAVPLPPYEINALRDQIRQCWSLPNGVTIIAPIIKLQFMLNRDGSLSGDPILLNPGRSPLFKSTADSAMRAVRGCQPYKLPLSKNDAWSVEMAFDPTSLGLVPLLK